MYPSFIIIAYILLNYQVSYGYIKLLRKANTFSSFNNNFQIKNKDKKAEEYDGDFLNNDWDGSMDGFDWQLERARRLLEGPAFAPIRMTLWQPNQVSETSQPGFFDHFKILLNNALQMVGLADSLDGAPLVQGVNTFKGSPWKLLSKVIDGDLAELAGGPLFLLLNSYYKQYGPVYKLAFGPKSFIVVSDPVMAKHILKEAPQKYDKGILAEILEPVMGKVGRTAGCLYLLLSYVIFFPYFTQLLPSP